MWASNRRTTSPRQSNKPKAPNRQADPKKRQQATRPPTARGMKATKTKGGRRKHKGRWKKGNKQQRQKQGRRVGHTRGKEKNSEAGPAKRKTQWQYGHEEKRRIEPATGPEAKQNEGNGERQTREAASGPGGEGSTANTRPRGQQHRVVRRPRSKAQPARKQTVETRAKAERPGASNRKHDRDKQGETAALRLNGTCFNVILQVTVMRRGIVSLASLCGCC